MPGGLPRPVKTGMYVKAPNGLRLRHRRVRRLVAKMHESMPWLAPADLPACRAWAELEILGARAFAELETNGITNTAGEPRRLLGEYRQLRQAQLAYERDLGMTPAARMALRVNDSRARSTDLLAQLADEAAKRNGGVEEKDGGPSKNGRGTAKKHRDLAHVADADPPPRARKMFERPPAVLGPVPSPFPEADPPAPPARS